MDSLQITQQETGLKFCNDEIRLAPDTFLRSSLFGITKRDRELVNNKLIASASGINIYFSGTELNQADLLIFTEIVHISRTKNENGLYDLKECSFKITDFLKKIGKRNSGAEIQQFKNSIDRLNKSNIKTVLADGKAGYGGNLISTYDWDNYNDYKITVDPKLALLFTKEVTRLNHETQLELADNALLSWLYNFYKSHVNNGEFLYKIETIKEMCGSKDKSLPSFKQKLNSVMWQLEKITNWECSIIDNKVSILDFNAMSENKLNEWKIKRMESMPDLTDEDRETLNDPDYIPY